MAVDRDATLLSRTEPPPRSRVTSLQRDLGALGYYIGNFGGVWDTALDAAVCAVRYDLTHPVAGPVADYNTHGEVVAAPPHGPAAIEPALAAAIAAMVADPAYAKLPTTHHAADENARALAAVAAPPPTVAPLPFVVAVVGEESGGRHYRVLPDGSGILTLAFDRRDGAAPDRITSRGYGIGGERLFRHPPRVAEMTAMGDAAAAGRHLAAALRDAFDHLVVVAEPALRAADRGAEWPISPLRLCRYPRRDPRYLADCRACARAAGTVATGAGHPLYPGAGASWATTARYAARTAAPDRTGFVCDWPFAVRRYAGSGLDSYHYQARVLARLAEPEPSSGEKQ